MAMNLMFICISSPMQKDKYLEKNQVTHKIKARGLEEDEVRVDWFVAVRREKYRKYGLVILRILLFKNSCN